MAADDTHLPHSRASFENVCIAQRECWFFQLPAEIRLKVLRLLYKFPTPLQPCPRTIRSPGGTSQPITDVPLLWPQTQDKAYAQTLATCQKYYGEACQVLYGENILVISTDEDTNAIEILDVSVKPGCWAQKTRVEGHDLLSLMQKQGYHSRFEEYYHALVKIKNIQLQSKFVHKEDAYVVFRTLQTFLEHKNVTCIPWEDRSPCYWKPNCIDEFFEIFQSLRWLRCASFVWSYREPFLATLRTALPDDPVRLHKPIFEAHMVELVKQVTSHQKLPLDLHPIWISALEVWCRLPKIDKSWFFPHLDDLDGNHHAEALEYLGGRKILKKLCSAVFEGDAPSVAKYIAKISERAAAWNEKTAAEEAAEALASIEENRLSLAQALNDISTSLPKVEGE